MTRADETEQLMSSYSQSKYLHLVIFGSHHLGLREKTKGRKILQHRDPSCTGGGGGNGFMNSGVRIIKRDRAHVLQSSPVHQHDKTGQTSEREIAGTVKNWIIELAQRRRADEL